MANKTQQKHKKMFPQVGRGLLSSLAQLQILNLGHNKIANVEAGSFSKLRNLHVLILSHNKLR